MVASTLVSLNGLAGALYDLQLLFLISPFNSKLPYPLLIVVKVRVRSRVIVNRHRSTKSECEKIALADVRRPDEAFRIRTRTARLVVSKYYDKSSELQTWVGSNLMGKSQGLQQMNV
jgi:hypothetical protein